MKLQDYIDWCNASTNRFLEVWNATTEQKEVKLNEASEAAFMELLNKGVTTIGIQRFEKRGTASVRVGMLKKFNLGKTEENQPKESVVDGGGGAKTPPAKQHINHGLGMPGLGFSEVMSLNTKASKYDELKADYDLIKRKNEELEKENKKLEKENLRYELNLEGKPSAVEKLLENLTPETIGTIAQMVMAAKSGTGANQAALAAPNLTPIKTAAVAKISEETTPDKLVSLSYQVIDQYEQNNQAFINEYQELLQKHLNHA